MNILWFIMGIWLGYGLKLLTAEAIIKISKAYHNLFMDYYRLKKNQSNINNKSLSCSCNNGMIECPACKDASEKDKIKYVCAGCNGKGWVICGKCNGRNKRR